MDRAGLFFWMGFSFFSSTRRYCESRDHRRLFSSHVGFHGPLGRDEMIVNYCILVARMLLVYFYMFGRSASLAGPRKTSVGLRVVGFQLGTETGHSQVDMWREFIAKTIGRAYFGFRLRTRPLSPGLQSLHDLLSASVVKRVRGTHDLTRPHLARSTQISLAQALAGARDDLANGNYFPGDRIPRFRGG